MGLGNNRKWVIPKTMECKAQYKLKITLPILPKSTNQQTRMHWAAKAKMVKEIKVAVLAIVGRNKPSKPLEHAKLVLTRHSASQPDYDGLVSSFKHVLDGLIECGVLEDDDWDHIGAPTYLWELAPRKKGFIQVIVLEDLDT